MASGERFQFRQGRRVERQVVAEVIRLAIEQRYPGTRRQQ